MQWQWILLLALLVFFGWEADRRSKEIKELLDKLNLTLSRLYASAERKQEKDRQPMSTDPTLKVLNEAALWEHLSKIGSSLNAIKDELAKQNRQ